MENIEEQLKELNKISPKEYACKAMNNEISEIMLGYFAYSDTDNVNPFIKRISRSVLAKNQAKILETQSKYMLWSAIGACLAAIFSLISIFIH